MDPITSAISPGARATRPIIWLALCVAILGAIGAASGVFLRGDLDTLSFTSVRGETVDAVVDGPYRFNGLAVASEGVGWDAVTLFLVVPALLIGLWGLQRGSLRARLFVAGLLVYFLYQGLEYAMLLAFGPLFPVHVATFALAGSALAILAATVDLRTLAMAVDGTAFPRRAVTALGAFMAVLLSMMWLPMVATNLTATVVEPLDGATTLVVQALDLGFLVPLGVATAILAWRGSVLGYALACVVVVKAVAMASAIVAMLLVEAAETGELAIVPIAVFAITAAAAAAIGVQVFRSVHAAGWRRPGAAATRRAPSTAG